MDLSRHGNLGGKLSAEKYSTRYKSSSESALDSNRVQFWLCGPFPAGITVDELAAHRRRQIPRENPSEALKLERGSFSQLKTEYKKRFKEYPLDAILHAYRGTLMDNWLLRKIRGKRKESAEFKPNENFGKLGQVESEHHKQFVAHEGVKRAELQRKNTLLHPEGEFSKEASEVQSSYRGYTNVERMEPIRRSSNLKMEGEMETSTEQHDQYGPKTVTERAHLLRRNTNIHIPADDMDLMTENHDQFVQYEHPEKSEMLRHPETLRMEGDIEFNPEYDEQFVKFEDAHKSTPLRQESTLRAEGEMDMNPEYNEQFRDYHNERPLFPRPKTHLQTEGEFNPITEEREHYVKFEANRPYFPRPQTHLQNEGNFDSTTEQGDNFKEFDANRPYFPRPKTHLQTEGDFDPSTEKGENFVEFEANRPYFPRPKSHLQPEGEFHAMTEKKENFVEFDANRPLFPRPKTHLQTEGKFDDSTEQGENYQDFKAGRPYFPRPKTHLQTEGDFEATSEIKAEYKKITEPPKTETARPPTSLRLAGGIEAEPEYKSTFVNHPRERAIAGKIPDTLRRPSGDYKGNMSENRENFKPHNIVKRGKNRPKTHLRLEGDFYADPEYKANYQDCPLEEKNFASRKLYKEGPDHINFDGYDDKSFKVLSLASSKSGNAKKRSKGEKVNENEERPSYRLEVCPADRSKSSNEKSFVVIPDENNNIQPQSDWVTNKYRRRDKNKWAPSWAGEDKK